MKKILSIFLGSSIFIVVLYLLFADFEQEVVNMLKSPGSLATYSALSFGFLLSDILLPVPSSLIMILNGKVLGVFWGTLLSLTSGLLASTIGYILGRSSQGLINRFFSQRELNAGNRLFDRYGKGAVALSKALPVLSESVAILSGTTSMRFSSFLAFSFCGHAVVSLIYAYVGNAAAAFHSNLVSAVIIGLTLVVAWLLQWATTSRKSVGLANEKK